MRLYGTALLLLLVSAQAFAWGDVRMVCRYTGRVLTDCPCPAEEGAAPALERLDCCLIEASEPLPAAPLLPSLRASPDPSLGWAGVATFASGLHVGGSWPRVSARERARPPPRRLFIANRQLLI